MLKTHNVLKTLHPSSKPCFRIVYFSKWPGHELQWCKYCNKFDVFCFLCPISKSPHEVYQEPIRFCSIHPESMHFLYFYFYYSTPSNISLPFHLDIQKYLSNWFLCSHSFILIHLTICYNFPLCLKNTKYLLWPLI